MLQVKAYFEVAKNSRQPFIVKTRSETIKVLGTHFNVNAYEDEKFKIRYSLLKDLLMLIKIFWCLEKHI